MEFAFPLSLFTSKQETMAHCACRVLHDDRLSSEPGDEFSFASNQREPHRYSTAGSCEQQEQPHLFWSNNVRLSVPPPLCHITSTSSHHRKRLSNLLCPLLLLAVVAMAQATNSDVWHHQSSSSPSPSAHRNMMHKKLKQLSYSTSSQSNTGVAMRRSMPTYGVPSQLLSSHRLHSPLVNFDPYLNSQLLSLPFTSHHQMLYRHSPRLPPPPPSSTSFVTSLPMASNRIQAHHQLESNHLSPHTVDTTNMIRAKGSKWW